MTVFIIYLLGFKAKREKTNKKNIIPKGEQYEVLKDRIMDLNENIQKLEYEDVWISSYDGLKLHGRYYPTEKHNTVDICFHGYRTNALRDFSGGITLLKNLDHDVIIVDERAHGESKGNTITFGAKEKYDCISWIKFCSNKFGENIPIFLYGISMGAATVIMASELQMPGNVKGIIADSPYSSAEEIILKVVTEHRIPKYAAKHLISAGTKIFGRFDLEEANAVEAAKKTDLPILIIHGDADKLVPCKMSEYIKKANIDKVELYVFHGAGHGLSYLVDTERYSRIIKSFVDRCISI